MKKPPLGILTQQQRQKLLIESEIAVKESTADYMMRFLVDRFGDKSEYTKLQIETAIRATLNLPVKKL